MRYRRQIIGPASLFGEITHLLAEHPARVVIDPVLTTGELRQFIASYRGQPDEDVLLQLAAVHAAATEDILLEMARRWDRDAGVLNAIATSPRATLPVLRALESASIESIRQHALVGLLRRNFAEMSEVQMRELLTRHSEENGVDIGVRLIVASAACTPLPLLLQLLQDEVDIVVQAAQRELDRRQTDG